MPAVRPADLREIRKTARQILAKGLMPLPLSGKVPIQLGWQGVTNVDGQIDTLFTDGSNIGLRLDTLTDVDLDAPEAIFLAQYFLKSTSSRWGRDGARNSHHLYLVDNSQYESFLDPLAEKRQKPTIVEIRHGSGHQSMLPPSVHPDTGEVVRWEGEPVATPEKWAYPELRRAVGKLASAVLLTRHLQKTSRHSAWLCLGGAMRRAEWTREDAVHFTKIVAGASRDDEVRDRVRAVESSFEDGKTEIAGLKKLEEYLPKEIVRKLAQWLDLRRSKVEPFDLDDDSNAQAVFAAHGDDLHYLPSEGKGGLWLFFNDVIWKRDHLSYVQNLTANLLKKKADDLTAGSRDLKFTEKVRRELLNVPGVVGALNRLSWFPEIALANTALDLNPWLIGLVNGVYDLKNDRLEDGAREQLVSRQITASYDKGATCPRWVACIERAQPSEEMQAFVRRVAGSCLLGMQTEHGFIFNWGRGANFKTAYSEVLRRVMGDEYSLTPNEELFFKGSHEVPRNYLADIHGMRLLTTNETHEGSSWNIEFIKQILGGQQLNACRKYCEAFSFVPTARIIAAANNKPRLDELDEAVRRRFLLVPWETTIPEKVDGMGVLSPTEQDPEVVLDHLRRGPRMPFEQLMRLLLEERSGILNWMLGGAREFIKRGLRLDPPTEVVGATESYFADENVVQKFVEECCEMVPVPSGTTGIDLSRRLQDEDCGTSSSKLHEAFTGWSGSGKYALGQRKFTIRLEKIEGVVKVRGNRNRMFLNLVLTAVGKNVHREWETLNLKNEGLLDVTSY